MNTLEVINEVINFEEQSYKSLCEEMACLIQTEKELKARKDILKEEILKQSGGERLEFGIKVAKRVVKGTVDYKELSIASLGNLRLRLCKRITENPQKSIGKLEHTNEKRH